MFGLFRATLRAFAVGVAIGVLFAPRAGADTRKVLNVRIAAFLNQMLEVAALPPIQTGDAATNGHAERAPAKRTRAAGTDARPSA
jgi:hypothetical protein